MVTRYIDPESHGEVEEGQEIRRDCQAALVSGILNEEETHQLFDCYDQLLLEKVLLEPIFELIEKGMSIPAIGK